MSRSGGRVGPSRKGSAKMSSVGRRRPSPPASGPSKQATIWLAPSGSAPNATGTRPVRPNIEAARQAVTAPKGPSPSTIGVDSATSVASTLAGLTKDSEDGRQPWRSRRARRRRPSRRRSTDAASPMASAASRAGVAWAHIEVREDGPARRSARGPRAPGAHLGQRESAAPIVTTRRRAGPPPRPSRGRRPRDPTATRR